MTALRKVSVGVVGGGNVGVMFSKFLRAQEETRLAGIVTKNAARQAELSKMFDVPSFGSVEQLMRSGDKPEVVAVVNANDEHYAATVAALEAGAHVFCEKPMAPTLEECRKMVEAEKKSGKSLQIGFEYMHGTMTRRLKQLVAEGYFGELTWMSVLDSRGHWWSDSPFSSPESHWKLDRKRGGGIVLHCGIHQLDMIRTYLGPIEEVTAYRGAKNALSFYPEDVPDNVTLMLRARSGAVCNFQIFHNRAPCYYRQTTPFVADWRHVPGHDFDLSLIGTKGSCEMRIYKEKLSLFRFDQQHKDTVFERTEDFSPNSPSASHHDMNALLLAYLRNVAAGKGAVDPACGAVETMKLAFAAEDAIAQKRTVKLSEYAC